MKAFVQAAVAGAALFSAMPARATRQLTYVGTDLSATTPTSIAFGSSTFSFGLNNPSTVTVQNSAGAAIQAFGGFLFFALTPSASFTNRGDVTYGPTGTQFASFTTPTADSAIAQDSFVGLRAASGNGNLFGFAYLQGTRLVGYGYESSSNGSVTATTDFSGAVPEPATWAMMLGGFGLVGATLRRRRVAATA